MHRGNEPFRGMWCLPGGKVDPGGTVEQGAMREVQEDLDADVVLHGILDAYSEPGRDPRGPYIWIAWHGSSTSSTPTPKEEAIEIKWLARGEECQLGFEHDDKIQDHWKGARC